MPVSMMKLCAFAVVMITALASATTTTLTSNLQHHVSVDAGLTTAIRAVHVAAVPSNVRGVTVMHDSSAKGFGVSIHPIHSGRVSNPGDIFVGNTLVAPDTAGDLFTFTVYLASTPTAALPNEHTHDITIHIPQGYLTTGARWVGDRDGFSVTVFEGEPMHARAGDMETAEARLLNDQVDAYQSTWAHMANVLQRDLDADLPLRKELWTASHNSYNSRHYATADVYYPFTPTMDPSEPRPPAPGNEFGNAVTPTATADPNHDLDLESQLRLDMQGVELDIHRVFRQEDQAYVPTLCHVVCGPQDRHLRDGLLEIKNFLDRPEHADDVIQIDLELTINGDEAILQEIVDLIDEIIGFDLLFLPPQDGQCYDIPVFGVTRNSIRAQGKRVMLTGVCMTDFYNDRIWSIGNRRQAANEGGNFRPYPDCGSVGARSSPDENVWTRHWEDTTYFSNAIRRTLQDITAPVLRDMLECTINMASLDQLTPTDPRLEAQVWSWAPSQPEPVESLRCASQREDGRFYANACQGTSMHFACRTDEFGDAWAVTKAKGTWGEGNMLCAREGLGLFSTPGNAQQNRVLKDVKTEAGVSEVFLNYHRTDGMVNKWRRDVIPMEQVDGM